MTSSSDKPEYFNLHTSGIGYVNRVRDVPTPRNGDPYLACTIAALNGPKNDVLYRYIDCTVVGEKAQELIRLYEPAVKQDRKVLIGFNAGDLWVDAFIYTKEGHPKKGKAGASLKARLLLIEWIKIDGEFVYSAKPQTTTETDTDEGTGAGVGSAPALGSTPQGVAIERSPASAH